MASYVKFEDMTFNNLSVFHYNFHEKQTRTINLLGSAVRILGGATEAQ